jgi:hypothetical protein
LTDPSTPDTRSAEAANGATSEVPGFSFLPALADFLRLVDESGAKPGPLKAAFRRFRRDALLDWVVLAEWAERQTEDRLVWLIGELALDPKVLKTTRRRSIRLIRSDQTVFQSLIALVSTVQISAKSMDKEFRTGTKKRSALFKDVTPVGSPQSLFWNEPPGIWPVEKAAAASDAALDPGIRQNIARFATAGLPLAVEAQARREILDLARADKESAADFVRKKKLALRSLAGTLRGIVDVAASRASSDVLQREYRRLLILAIGKKPDVWHAIEKDRRPLFSAKELTGPALLYWADIAALTWVSTKRSTELLSKLNGAQLAALFAAASERAAPSLRVGIMETISDRPSDMLSDLEWTVFERHASKDVVIRRWYDATRSKAKTEQPLAYLRGANADDQARGFKSFVASLDDYELANRNWKELAAEIAPSASLAGLSLLIDRLKELIIENESGFYARNAENNRKSAVIIESAVEKLQEVLDCKPEKLTKTATDAASRLRKLANEIAAHADSVKLKRRRNVASMEEEKIEMSGSSPDLIELLRNLESQATKSSRNAKMDRSRAEAAFQQALNDDPKRVKEVIEVSDSLPPEAMGLLWDAGIRLGVESVLETVGTISRLHEWGDRVWLDVLLHRAATVETALPLPDDVAEASQNLLLLRLGEQMQRLSDPDVTGMGRKNVEAANKSLEQVQRAIETVITDLSELRDTIAGAYDGDSTTGG